MILRHLFDAGEFECGLFLHSTGSSRSRYHAFRFSCVYVGIFLLNGPVFAVEKTVPWLAEVTTVPATVPATSLSSLYEEPLTKERWAARRSELRKLWLDTLGPMPPRPQTTTFRVLRTDDLPEVTRFLIEYECEAGLNVQAYLLRPKDAKPDHSRAGMVALHPTTTETIEPIAGVTGEPRQHLGLELARRGFVVICPRCFLWQDVSNYQEAVDRFRKRHPQTLGMHKMLYDAQRALDILAALPEVDANRIGAVGHSLGAKETLYLAAFDDRVKAALASEGGIGLTSTNWDAPWYLGSGVRESAFKRDHHELVALIAPRPFLVIAGESGNGAADGDRSWPYLEAARPIYALTTPRPALGILNHRRGHPLPIELFPKVAEWFEVYLAE